MAGTEIAIPFGLDVTGQVATTADLDVQSQNHVDSLVSTNPGERVMRPGYGVPVRSYLFEPGPDVVDQSLVLDIRQQMAQWEPSLTVINIAPVPAANGEPGLAEVNVAWEYAQALQPATQNAVVNVGGTVVNS